MTYHVFNGVTTENTLVISGGHLAAEEAMDVFLSEKIIESPNELRILNIVHCNGIDPDIEDDVVLVDITAVLIEWVEVVEAISLN